MPRDYHRRTEKASWTSDQLKAAISAEKITPFEVVQIYIRVATPEKAIKEFQFTGISPTIFISLPNKTLNLLGSMTSLIPTKIVNVPNNDSPACRRLPKPQQAQTPKLPQQKTSEHQRSPG
ncbi:hypothetical protein ILUMI_14405 [Ignelater luminosus]|uniref:Uncharacterized protein n=1 Tax=Ignelater luminosus TaxID=2038154 RepID=A0A8K0CW06_IGNLU|nr:hypothetical protein ILUMI_14405 [Ignelater luminosus]